MEGIVGCCPAHDDRSPSFYAWVSADGWLNLRCAICSPAAIMAALGVTDDDRRPAGYEKRPDQVEYVYRDTHGQPLLRKVRTMRDGRKDFHVQNWRNGSWVMGKGAASAPLYRLPEVLSAVQGGRTVYINEGEKACDALAAQGLAATCQPFGANGSNWSQQHTQLLKNAHAVIVADRDEVGEKYARHIAAQLQGVACSVRVVQSCTEAEKDDAFDHLAAGHGEDDWVDRHDLLPPRGLSTRRFHKEDFAPVELDFLIEPHLPRGKCVLLDADGGTGKTSLAIALAAALSNGYDPVNEMHLERRMRTLYLHKGEDQDDELATVFAANGGDFDCIDFYNGDLCLDDAGIRQIEEEVRDGCFDLVVLDAFFYFLQGLMPDTNVALDAMRVMDRLNRMAGRTGCTVVNIRHTTKGTVGKRASDLGMGSVQFRNSHRGQLVARWHPTNRGLVVVTDEKGSLLVPRGPHFCYRRVDENEVQFVLDVDNPFDEGISAPMTKLGAAKDMLRKLLTGQYVAVTRLTAWAAENDICPRTLKKARANLGVKAIKDGRGGWMAHLPAPEEPEDPFAIP